MTLPVTELPDIADRDYWVPGDVNAEGRLEVLHAVVGAEAVAFSGTPDDPIQIVLI
ncbi:hypothetical protein [uncultured Tateyamaria sp.]|uniref:hypothetical protein n=1 Tax=uncultured Tateyamaria sp. TaxID=455651 RepID=UPI00261D1E46|nr:hypothetical protein [uncultured Tateyamaria sp.]